jgi:hypothetical protein
VLRSALVLMVLALVGCSPDIPEGVLRCQLDSDCPRTWFCHTNTRCYSDPEDVISDAEPTPIQDAEADTAPVGMDAQTGDVPVPPLQEAGPTPPRFEDVIPGTPPTQDGEAPIPHAPMDAAPNVPADAGPDADITAAPRCDSADAGIVCDDGKFCNGVETCTPAHQAADARGCVPGAAVMCPAGQSCSELLKACSPCNDVALDDADLDGHESMACGGTDCDDSDPLRHRGRAETCDARDNDCDLVVDGPTTDTLCMQSAPSGAVSSCVAGACAPRCTDPDFVLGPSGCQRRNDCPAIDTCAPGSCLDGTGTYSCSCPPTHVASGTTCADLNECLAGPHDCDLDPPACINTVGSFTCQCPPTHMGTGRGPDGCQPIPIPPTDCGATWAPARALGPTPLGAYLTEEIRIRGVPYYQFLCRVSRSGVIIPGKVNSVPNSTAGFEYGCYVAFRAAGGPWQEYEAREFEVLTPPSGCLFSWVAASSGAALPARAVRTGSDANGAAIHSCRARFDDANSVGYHMGRVGGAEGDVCAIQYFGGVPPAMMTYEVLVQTAP